MAERSELAKQADRTGREFEAAIAAQFDLYQASGRAIAEHLHPPTAMMPGANGLRRIIGKARIDFAGTLGPESPFPRRSLYVECKHTTKRAPSLPIAPKREKVKGKKTWTKSGIRMEQLERAVELHRFGAVVGLLWRNGDSIGVMDGPGLTGILMSVNAGGRKSIPRELFLWMSRESTDFLPTLLSLYAR